MEIEGASAETPLRDSWARSCAFAMLAGLALYWVSNLFLWFPWSASETLGIVLMLTVSPLIWAFGTIHILRRRPHDNLWTWSLVAAATLLVISVGSDLVFFGILRDALDSLLQPTTYAAYLWVAVLPFLISGLGYRRPMLERVLVSRRALITCGLIALLAAASITVIITADLRLGF